MFSALRVALVTKLVISGILSSICLISALYTSFLTTSFFTTSLSLLFKLIKLLGTFFNLLISNLSTSDFKLAKLTFFAKSDVATSVAFFKFDLIWSKI